MSRVPTSEAMGIYGCCRSHLLNLKRAGLVTAERRNRTPGGWEWWWSPAELLQVRAMKIRSKRTRHTYKLHTPNAKARAALVRGERLRLYYRLPKAERNSPSKWTTMNLTQRSA